MAPTKEISNVDREKIVNLLKGGLSTRIVAKQVGRSQSAIAKIWLKVKHTGIPLKDKRKGRPRKTSKRDDRKLKSICLQNRKLTSTLMKTQWSEAGVDVCARTVRNRLSEMGFSYRKAKRKPGLTPAHKKKRLHWAKNKCAWTVEDWEKVIFSDESRICVGQGDDAGIFVWRRGNEAYSDGCIKKQVKFPTSVLIWSCMSSKGPGELAVVKTTVNSQIYIDILDHFLIPSIDNAFGDEDVVFQDDNASCHRAKCVRDFLADRQIATMDWPANSPDLNPIENMWMKLKKLVQAKSPLCKDDLIIAIRECWKEMDINYCQSLIRSMPARIKAVIKARGGVTKY